MLVIIKAGRNSRTHSLLISLAEDDLRRLNLAAPAPYPMVRRTARDACTAPRKLGKIPLDIFS